MFHTNKSEQRQFQQLRRAVTRECTHSYKAPLVAVTTVAEAIPRPVLEIRRTPPAVATGVTFVKKK